MYENGYRNVEGLDRSHYLISKARKISKENDFSIRFREGDAREPFFNDDSFDAVMLLGNSSVTSSLVMMI